MAEKYLYGAAVQGIQSFIFQTNKLREIVGASELVENICTKKIKELIGNYTEYDDSKKSGCILHAAGNIKYVFDNKEDCEKIVRIFPKEIAKYAPGITVSQAVVKMTSDISNFSQAVNELEKKLRAQRNKPVRSLTTGLMAVERSRQTGLPVVFIKEENRFGAKIELHADSGTRSKLYEDPSGKRILTTRRLCEKAFDKNFKDNQIAYDIEEVTGKNDWVAVIHADGNGLGQIVQKVGTDPAKFREFSEKLDKATVEAANTAYNELVDNNKIVLKEKSVIPIRPIVLGGDDLTVICRADIAVDYVTRFIKNFEEKTKQYLSSIITEHKVFEVGDVRDRLTACAGIAYIKSSYPFYYGYNLAESLCSQAKKDAKANIEQGKELPMSCIMFHKVEDSFTESWDSIVKRELTPQEDISLVFGPYYINDKKDRWTVGCLMRNAGLLNSKEGNAVKSHLRNWLSLLHTDKELAHQKKLRLLSLLKEGSPLHKLVEEVTKKVERGNKTIYSVYDMLVQHTINTQETKEEDNK